MMIIHLVLLILAAVLFGIASAQPGPLWNRLVAAGLTALTASMISW